MSKFIAIFDLDGTLTDSAPGIMNSIQYVIEKEGLRQLSEAEKRFCVGPPLGGSFINMFGVSRERAEELIKVYREYFSVKGLFENTIYDGILPLLESCKQAGIELWICTAKPHAFLLRILEHFALDQYFTQVLGADMQKGAFSDKSGQLAKLLENAASGDRCIMIGDRDQDIKAAGDNGILSLGALWGYGPREELQGAGADYLCTAPEEALALLLRLQREKTG